MYGGYTMENVQELEKLHAIIEIEKAYGGYMKDLYPVYEAGLSAIYDTFSFLDELQAISKLIFASTPFNIQDGSRELFLEEYAAYTEDLRQGRESEEEFYGRLFMVHANLGRKLTLEDKNNLTVELTQVQLQLANKVADLEAAGVKLTVFKENYIQSCINTLWGYNVAPIIEEFLSDEEHHPMDLRRELTRMYKAVNRMDD